MKCCNPCGNIPGATQIDGNCVYYPLTVWLVGGLFSFSKGGGTLNVFANGDAAALPFYPKILASNYYDISYTNDLSDLVDKYTSQGYTLTYSSQELVITDKLNRACAWNASPIPTTPPYSSVSLTITLNQFPDIPSGYVLSDDTGIYLPQNQFDGLARTYHYAEVKKP